MQQALQRSDLVPSGFVERVRASKVIRPLLRSGRREALVCVHRAERFPDVSIAGIGGA
jgi:hypothetical protein